MLCLSTLILAGIAPTYAQSTTSSAKGTTPSTHSEPTSSHKTMRLIGSVYDGFLGIPLSGHITLMRPDSTTIDTTTCKIQQRWSIYSFEVPNQTATYIIKAETEGYDTGYITVHAKASRSGAYEMADKILLRKKAQRDRTIDLNEVQVKATRIQVVYRGDTIVYDASAFVMPEGSLLGDLVRQMPGAEVKANGDVYVKGRKIDFMTLNGRNFFKGKNKMMLDNLPYFTIKDIKVFNREKTEREQIASGSRMKDYVMDVSLKPQYIRTALANGEAGAGTDGRWRGRLFGMATGKTSTLTLFANANNVNENRRPGSNGDWKPADQLWGTKTTRQVGVSYADEDRSRSHSHEAEVKVEWDNSDLQTYTHSEQWTGGGNIDHHAASGSYSRDFSIDLHHKWDDMINKNMPYSITTNVRYTNAHIRTLATDSTYRSALVNSYLNQVLSHSRSFTASTQALFFRRMANKDRISFVGYASYSLTSPLDQFGLRNTRYEQAAQADRRHLYSDQRSREYTYRLNSQYTLQLSPSWSIDPTVVLEHTYQQRHNAYYRLDWLGQYEHSDEVGILPSSDLWQQTAFDADNSSHYGLHKYRGQAMINISRQKNDGSFLVITLPIGNWTYSHMRFEAAQRDTLAHRWDMVWNPSVLFMKVADRRVRLRLSYDLNTAVPELWLLMPYTDASNPTSIQRYSSRLKRRIEQTANAYYANRVACIGLNYWLRLRAVYVYHAWGQRIEYDEGTGAMTYERGNIHKPNWNTSVSSGFDLPLDKARRWTLSVDDHVNYHHSVDFDITYGHVPGALSTVRTTEAGAGVKLQYIMGALRAGVSGKVNGRWARSHRAGFSDINTADYQYGATLQYTMPGIGTMVATDMNMYSRRGYASSEMNTNDLVWNALLTQSIIKGRLALKVQAFDLLHQLQTKRSTVNAQGRTETWYNSVPRYVMASLVFTMNKGKKP